MLQLKAQSESELVLASRPPITVVYAANLPAVNPIDGQADALLDAIGMPLDDIEITDQAKFLFASLPGGQIALPALYQAMTLKFRWAAIASSLEFGVVWRLYASVRSIHDPLRWRTLLTCLSLQSDGPEENLRCPWATWPLSLECVGLGGVFLQLGEAGLSHRPSSWSAVKVSELRTCATSHEIPDTENHLACAA